jgi:hypothetical protein
MREMKFNQIMALKNQDDKYQNTQLNERKAAKMHATLAMLKSQLQSKQY